MFRSLNITFILYFCFPLHVQVLIRKMITLIQEELIVTDGEIKIVTEKPQNTYRIAV